MHVVCRWEDGVVVGEDVVRGKRDKLAAAPKDLPEELEGVVRVGEVDDDGDEGASCVAAHVDAEHPRRARRVVGIAELEEAAGEVDRRPPTRDSPHTEAALDDNASGVAALRHGWRPAEGRSVELHGRAGFRSDLDLSGAWLC